MLWIDSVDDEQMCYASYEKNSTFFLVDLGPIWMLHSYFSLIFSPFEGIKNSLVCQYYITHQRLILFHTLSLGKVGLPVNWVNVEWDFISTELMQSETPCQLWKTKLPDIFKIESPWNNPNFKSLGGLTNRIEITQIHTKNQIKNLMYCKCTFNIVSSLRTGTWQRLCHGFLCLPFYFLQLSNTKKGIYRRITKG
jgi:hypothetical protein